MTGKPQSSWLCNTDDRNLNYTGPTGWIDTEFKNLEVFDTKSLLPRYFFVPSLKSGHRRGAQTWKSPQRYPVRPQSTSLLDEEKSESQQLLTCT